MGGRERREGWFAKNGRGDGVRGGGEGRGRRHRRRPPSRSSARGRGGNMAAGQSVSNRRDERSSYAESRRAYARRRYRSDSATLLRPLAVVSPGTHAPPRELHRNIWRGRAPRRVLSPRWVPWSTVSSSSSLPSPSLSIPPVSSRAFTGGSSRRPTTDNSRAKVGERDSREKGGSPPPGCRESTLGA